MKLRWPRSLIARILLAEIVTILLVAILLPVLMVHVLHHTTAAYQDQTLEAQARLIASSVEQDGKGGWHVRLSDAQSALYATGYDGRAFVVVDGSDHVLVSSPFAQALPKRTEPHRNSLTSFHTGQIVGISLPAQLSGTRLWVIVSQDQNGPGAILDDISRSFLTHYLWILLPVLLVLPLINSLAVGRLVIGVRRVSESAAAIDAHSLHVRLDDAHVPAEVAPLVTATNRLIDRLEGGFRQQGEFVANVAHELRTPLATLRLTLESVQDDMIRPVLDRQVERLSHVLSQLRDLAALEGPSMVEMLPIDLRALAIQCISDLAPGIIEHRHDIEFRCDAQTIPMTGNAALIELALVNLISNATRHTPTGTTIIVAAGPGATISVEDDGPGIATIDPDHLTRRFWRADTTRTDSAGIGLSIVRRIVDVHRGRLEIGASAAGGAAFTMLFTGSDQTGAA